MFYIVLLFFEVLFVNAMHSSRALEGYPGGYLSNCPGSMIPTQIPPDTLKLLTIHVQTSQTFFSPTATYSYYQMKELVKDPHLNFTKPTVLYVGGYLDHPIFFVGTTFGPLYKKLGYNVLFLNTNGFTLTHYSVAARNMRSISRPAAEILVHLTKNGMDPKQLSIIGLSLGAQTAGFIAKEYKLLTGNSISRITGLDPAGPCFRNLGPEDRLDESDADFVDIIDTNIDGYGMAAPIGHVNFYINGGEYQPGDFIGIPCTVLCSHIRAFTLWVAALNNPDCFIAMKCDSVQDARDSNCYERTPLVTNVIGLNTNRDVKGIFFVATTNNYPYYLREKGLQRKYEFFHSFLRISGTGKLSKKKTGKFDIKISKSGHY